MIGEIAGEALKRLDASGWTQGECSDEQGRVCMGTALWEAAGLPHDRDLSGPELSLWADISDAVVDVLAELHPEAPFSTAQAVPKFNDHASEAEVREVLQKIREDC